MKATDFIAGFDSASGMLRALGRYLNGQDFPMLGILPRWTIPVARPIVAVINALPTSVRETLYIGGGWSEAIRPERLRRVRVEELSRWVVSQYPKRRYPAVMIGSSNGAAVHLCAVLGIPWLPQTFLIPVRRSGIHPDEPKDDMEWGREPGRVLLESNPELQLHHMHDPVQDRLMIQRMTYFRVKRLRLGEAFQQFLEESLVPGGTVFVVDCRLAWPTTKVADRHFFQFGALGGATPEEYYGGSKRVADYLGRHGSHLQRWAPPEPDGQRPEAEWGFDEALLDDLERLARQQGYQIRRIVFQEPEDLSPLVADLYRWLYAQRDIEADRLLGESFVLMEP